MLYVVAIFAALLIGFVVNRIKGRRTNFGNVKFTKAWLILPSVLLQFISSAAEMKGYKFGTAATLTINGAVYVFVFLVIWFNRRYIGLWFLGIGGLLNAIVMMFNGGRMPVDTSRLGNEAYMEQAKQLILNGADNKHVAIDSATKIPALADIYSLPGVLGFGMPLISIGDIIISIGLFLLFMQIVLKSEKIENIH